MYEAGGTLVIETPGTQGDVVVDGKRVAATLEGLQQARAAMVASVGALESDNVKLTRQAGPAAHAHGSPRTCPHHSPQPSRPCSTHWCGGG